ncbi:hypothetical protein R5R35_013403 [Gryllus longicercus]|uniref:Cuticular protein n=1 Tax=Gryllus longicercus TaxID=2509291 RepID=A0AAN9ZG45_9ORTH|nr:Uncharacterized protein GBIM_02877 [Gryllus bimaculatus]
MAMLKCCMMVAVAAAVAMAAPQGNQYLPPTKGYDYPKPSNPFITPTTTQRPTTHHDGGVLLPESRPGAHDHHHHHEPGMPFDFQYAVKDDQFGTDYSHNAISDGDVVRGEYRVQLPDGRLQIVRYTADWATGFHADVQYEGEPRYPDGPAPGFGAPAPGFGGGAQGPAQGGRRPGGY